MTSTLPMVPLPSTSKSGYYSTYAIEFAAGAGRNSARNDSHHVSFADPPAIMPSAPPATQGRPTRRPQIYKMPEKRNVWHRGDGRCEGGIMYVSANL